MFHRRISHHTNFSLLKFSRRPTLRGSFHFASDRLCKALSHAQDSSEKNDGRRRKQLRVKNEQWNTVSAKPNKTDPLANACSLFVGAVCERGCSSATGSQQPAVGVVTVGKPDMNQLGTHVTTAHQAIVHFAPPSHQLSLLAQQQRPPRRQTRKRALKSGHVITETNKPNTVAYCSLL